MLCLTSAPAAAGAQEAAAPSLSPPNVLQIFVESVKPGKGAAHEKIEIGWPAAFRKAKWQSHYLAMASMNGPSEAWYMGAYASYAPLEADQRSVEKVPALARELEEADVAQESHGKPYGDALGDAGRHSSGTSPAPAWRPARRSSSPSARR